MLFDEYLDELCSSLQVDSLRRDEIRLELHTHLRERAAYFRKQGCAEEEAERWAVEEFGPAEYLAQEITSPKPDRTKWDGNRHKEYLGLLAIFSGASQFVYQAIFATLGIWEYQPSENQDVMLFILFFSVLLLPLLLMKIGRSLMLRRGNPLLPMLALLLFNCLTNLLITLLFVANEARYSIPTLVVAAFLFTLFVLHGGLLLPYGLWVLKHRDRRVALAK